MQYKYLIVITYTGPGEAMQYEADEKPLFMPGWVVFRYPDGTEEFEPAHLITNVNVSEIPVE